VFFVKHALKFKYQPGGLKINYKFNCNWLWKYKALPVGYQCKETLLHVFGFETWLCVFLCLVHPNGCRSHHFVSLRPGPTRTQVAWNSRYHIALFF